MSRAKPAVQRAESGLRTLIRDAQANGVTLLPSLNMLAVRLQVSRVTVLRAMRRMEQAGCVVGLPGRGYVVTGVAPAVSSSRPPRPSSRPPAPCPRWRELRDSLINDMLEGHFPPGSTLPSTKELCVRYGCGYSSLLHAIRSLLAERRLTRHGRRYVVREATAPKSQSFIGLVSFTHYPANLVLIGPHGAPLWRTMEHECTRRRLSAVGRDVAAAAAEPWPEGGTMVGCIMAHLGRNRKGPAQALRAILSARLPVALIDQGGCEATLAQEYPSPLVRCFALGTQRGCGRRVGEYLLARGHRGVLFIAPRDAQIERTRWKGVCEPFRKVGLTDAVVFRALDLSAPPRTGRTHEFVELMHRALGAADTLPVHEVGRMRRRALNFALGSFSSTVRAPETTRTLLAQMPQTEPATAWVAFNDELALSLLEYFQEAGIELPCDLSLVSFDDTTEAYLQGVTSYNFNIPALVNAVLKHILSPKRSGRRSPVVEIPGMVMERRTSGSIRPVLRS